MGGPAAYVTLFRDEFELDDGAELGSNDDELDFDELDDRELELDDGLGDIGYLGVAGERVRGQAPGSSAASAWFQLT